MKTLRYFIASLFLIGLTANATTTETKESTLINRGYGNTFIFVEQGIEFSLFPDGQFDFFMQNYGPNVNVSIGNRHSNISFNSGYDYNRYVQYDEFGAIIQIEHVPVYYDFYGRVSQVGNVFVNYNHLGFVTRVGGLYVHYNRYNSFSHTSGFINAYNRAYVYRPWHTHYRIPALDFRVVYNRPYRQFYTPTRYNYSRPFTQNRRRVTAVASRRGNTISRDRNRATVSNNTPRRNNTAHSPRQTTPRATTPRTVTSTPRSTPRTTTSTPRSTPRKATSTPRSTPRSVSTPRSSTSKPRTVQSSPRSTPRTVSTPKRTQTNRTVASTITRTSTSSRSRR